MPPNASEAPGLPSAEFEAKHTSLPGFSEGKKILSDGHATPDDSFVRHDAYFFKDGNVTFLVHCLLCILHTRRTTDQPVGGRFAILRPSILLFS